MPWHQDLPRLGNLTSTETALCSSATHCCAATQFASVATLVCMTQRSISSSSTPLRPQHHRYVSSPRRLGFSQLLLRPRAMARAANESLVGVTTTQGGLQLVELRRHKALNAVNNEMVQQIHDAVTGRAGRRSALLIQSTSDRAFCSGGDIKALRQASLEAPFSGAAPEGHKVRNVFLAEYRLIAALATLEVPAVAICQGVCMGFGVGLAAWLPLRVVTEQTVFAMPECSIGLFPDVAFALVAASRMPLCVALYLGLTGVRINDPADLLQFGLGTHYVPSDRLAELRAQLADCTLSASNAADKLRQCVESCARRPPPAGADSIAAHMDTVEGVMRPGIDVMDGGGSCVDAICAVQSHAQELTEQSSLPAAELAVIKAVQQSLAKASPRSLALTMQHIFQAATRMAGQHDFLEGVRAAVVDKDRCPHWAPGSLRGVDATSVKALLECADDLREALRTP